MEQFGQACKFKASSRFKLAIQAVRVMLTWPPLPNTCTSPRSWFKNVQDTHVELMLLEVSLAQSGDPCVRHVLRAGGPGTHGQ